MKINEHLLILQPVLCGTLRLLHCCSYICCKLPHDWCTQYLCSAGWACFACAHDRCAPWSKWTFYTASITFDQVRAHADWVSSYHTSTRFATHQSHQMIDTVQRMLYKRLTHSERKKRRQKHLKKACCFGTVVHKLSPCHKTNKKIHFIILVVAMKEKKKIYHRFLIDFIDIIAMIMGIALT